MFKNKLRDQSATKHMTSSRLYIEFKVFSDRQIKEIVDIQEIKSVNNAHNFHQIY